MESPVRANQYFGKELMIDKADESFVINVGGYIGSSTRLEIEYALTIGKLCASWKMSRKKSETCPSDG